MSGDPVFVYNLEGSLRSIPSDQIKRVMKVVAGCCSSANEFREIADILGLKWDHENHSIEQ